MSQSCPAREGLNVSGKVHTVSTQVCIMHGDIFRSKCNILFKCEHPNTKRTANTEKHVLVHEFKSQRRCIVITCDKTALELWTSSRITCIYVPFGTRSASTSYCKRLQVPQWTPGLVPLPRVTAILLTRVIPSANLRWWLSQWRSYSLAHHQAVKAQTVSSSESEEHLRARPWLPRSF
jgi:hypothetical protein